MKSPAIIGLGHVGIPLARAFARHFAPTLGFDVDAQKVASLQRGEDPTGSLSSEEVATADLVLSSDPASLDHADFYIIAVPTPIDALRRPDLGPLRIACETVGAALAPGDLVVVESTVYPGATAEECVPVLEAASGLCAGVDFGIGYSPERINPGDREHTLETLPKIVAADDAETLEQLAACYERAVPAGVHRVGSIRVAEAAKVIENVQRDLNIALMNELAMLFDRLELDTREVLALAATKWNFHSFHPGLVGGHCIGVDPYYLTMKAEAVGFHPQVILAGRRINDGMGHFVVAKMAKLLHAAGRSIGGARIAVLGLAFKPEVADARGSLVPGMLRELRDFGAEPLLHDPLVDPGAAADEHGVELLPASALTDMDAILLATPHRSLCELALRLVADDASQRIRVLVDVLAGLDPDPLPGHVGYWRL